MNHPQIDKAWEHAPEFTRDTLKVISDQSAEIETLKIEDKIKLLDDIIKFSLFDYQENNTVQ